VLLISLLALSAVTRASSGNVNRDEDLGAIVAPRDPNAESNDGGEAGTVDPNYVPVIPNSEE